MHKNRPTLRDVAAAAGVSIPAVSQALNGTGQLSQATRERVQGIAREMGYRPNRYAASLRRQRAMTIGFVSDSDSNSDVQRRWAAFYSRQLNELVVAAVDRGFTVTVIPDNRPDMLAVARAGVPCVATGRCCMSR